MLVVLSFMLEAGGFILFLAVLFLSSEFYVGGLFFYAFCGNSRAFCHTNRQANNANPGQEGFLDWDWGFSVKLTAALCEDLAGFRQNRFKSPED